VIIHFLIAGTAAIDIASGVVGVDGRDPIVALLIDAHVKITKENIFKIKS
jgi:hypothetical protein